MRAKQFTYVSVLALSLALATGPAWSNPTVASIANQVGSADAAWYVMDDNTTFYVPAYVDTNPSASPVIAIRNTRGDWIFAVAENGDTH